jgi:hypothetical protein
LEALRIYHILKVLFFTNAGLFEENVQVYSFTQVYFKNDYIEGIPFVFVEIVSCNEENPQNSGLERGLSRNP